MLLTVQLSLHVVCVCVCVCVRGTESHHSGVYRLSEIIAPSAVLTSTCVQTHTSIIHYVCHVTLFPFRAWTDGKTNDIYIFNVFIFTFKAEACDIGKGDVIFPTCACCVRPITMHWVKAGQSEQTVLVGRRGFVDNDTFERGGGIEELQ